MRQKNALATAALALMGSTCAQAGIMDFGYGDPLAGQGYAQNGLVLSEITGLVPFAERIRDWPTTLEGPDPQFSASGGYGERELQISDGAGRVIFSGINSQRFDLISFDVENPAGLHNWSVGGHFTVEASNGYSMYIHNLTYYDDLIGKGLGGSVSFKMDQGFENISWFAISCEGCQFALDNIEFQAVPEPSSIPLFAFGAFAGAFITYRRHSPMVKDLRQQSSKRL